MKKIIIFVIFFLMSACAYCQQATEKEKEIYYVWREWQNTVSWDTLSKEETEAKNKEFASRYGLTPTQIIYLALLVREAPLTDKEKEITKELQERICVYGRKPPEDIALKVCKELSEKHRIRLGEALYLWDRTGCYQLTADELKLYYDYVEWTDTLPWETMSESEDWEADFEAKEHEFLKGKGITSKELSDIEDRAEHTPLSARELEVAQELKTRLSSYGKDVPDDVRRKVCKEVAQRYGMRLGEIFNVFDVAILGFNREE
jgi:DNA-binding CsgD family transcriptional regulator